MTKHELIKLLDSTFPDVKFDIFEDIEGIVRVNFVIDKEDNICTLHQKEAPTRGA